MTVAAVNRFKTAIAAGDVQVGLWQTLASGLAAEVCATAGFDWLLFDGEHAPNTLQTLLAQVHAVSAYPVEPIARPPIGRPEILKQYLDLGFRTLLIPMVNTAAQACDLVAATRFPPAGVRGVASAAVRASAFGTTPDYLGTIHERLCLIAQIESADALRSLDDIVGVDGIDAIFIGPADLAASLGYLGNPRHPEVQRAIMLAIGRVRAAGKPVGIFALDAEDAREKIAAGVSFVSVGTDIGLLVNGAGRVLADVRQDEVPEG